MRLTPRLRALLAQCQPGVSLWDLCCDHGYLGEAAWHSGRFTDVVFNDRVENVLTGLRQRLPKARILCLPAEDIAEPLTGNVIIAGVGGEKIFHILSVHARRATLCARRLIVCPEKDAAWLAGQNIPGYTLAVRERIPHNHGERLIYCYDPI